MIGCIFVCGRDEACITPFLSAWSRVSNMEIVFIDDDKDPVKGNYGIRKITGKWPSKGSISQPVLESLATASKGHKEVLKLDVDCVHMSLAWLKRWNPETMIAMGQQNTKNPGCFMGAAYILNADAARQAAIMGDSCGVRPEDVGVSYKMRMIDPNGVHLISRRTHEKIECICGWDNRDELRGYHKYGIVHLGQRQSRRGVSSSMRALIAD